MAADVEPLVATHVLEYPYTRSVGPVIGRFLGALKDGRIEGVLLTNPKVGDAAVFGIPHDDWGEEVKAVLEPAAGVAPTPELADEILGWCAGRLAKFKTPKSIDFIAEMPRDPNGKLYKRKLRDPYWEGRERAI